MNRYLVTLIRRPDSDLAVVAKHQRYLEDLRAQGHNEMSGAFGDKSGGAYVMRAESLDQALEIAYRDPAHVSQGWDVTVREWQAQ
jgi:uncharacterized protein YciI